jgi:hypothetical protein
VTEIISRNVRVGQCTIYSLQTKKTQGYDILLLHGAKFRAATWKELKTVDRLDDAGMSLIGVVPTLALGISTARRDLWADGSKGGRW